MKSDKPIYYEQGAAKFCLSHQYELVDICTVRYDGVGHCTTDSELSGRSCGDSESSEVAAVRVGTKSANRRMKSLRYE